MNIAVFVMHEFELAKANGNWLGADAQETTDVDNHLASGATAVQVGYGSDFLIVRAINGSAFEHYWRESVAGWTRIHGMVDFQSPFGDVLNSPSLRARPAALAFDPVSDVVGLVDVSRLFQVALFSGTELSPNGAAVIYN